MTAKTIQSAWIVKVTMLLYQEIAQNGKLRKTMASSGVQFLNQALHNLSWAHIPIYQEHAQDKEYRELVQSITEREACDRVPTLPGSPTAPVINLSDIGAAAIPPSDQGLAEDTNGGAPLLEGEPEGTEQVDTESTNDMPDECELTKLADLVIAVAENLGYVTDPKPKSFLERA